MSDLEVLKESIVKTINVYESCIKDRVNVSDNHIRASELKKVVYKINMIINDKKN